MLNELLVGPWDLKGWSRRNGDLDVRQFIEDTETGRYPYGRYIWKLDRSDPWYQQLKMDVEAGLYDRTPESEERYQRALREYLAQDADSCSADRDALVQLFQKSGNRWTIMASLYSGDVPNDLWHLRKACDLAQRFFSHPEEGWRHG